MFKDIGDLLKQKESRILEFKESIPSTDKLLKTAIAFSNAQGGYLIIGVSNKGDIIGINEDEYMESEEKISHKIYDNCYPSIIPDIFSYRHFDKLLLVVCFYPSKNKPHYLKKTGKIKGVYIRIGSSNRLADDFLIEEMERQKRNISFDSVINYDLKYEDTMFKELDQHILAHLQEDPSIQLYKKLKLVFLEKGSYYLTNLGALFSENKSALFPFAKIECARFKGTKPKVFLDQATFDGNIISDIKGIMDFIKRNIALGANIGEIYREDRWEYPILSIRETLLNAIVHRDYSVLGSDIKVAIFDDMIEITSPGNLIIDKDNLGKGYSELRNPNLGALLKKFDLIEQWGSGFTKIFQELAEYPEIYLKIDDSANFVQIQFVKNDTDEAANDTDEVANDTDEVANDTDEAANDTDEAANDTDEALSRLELIKHELLNNNKISSTGLSKIFNISVATIKRDLKKLKSQNIIKRIGSEKNGYWEVLEK